MQSTYCSIGFSERSREPKTHSGHQGKRPSKGHSTEWGVKKTTGIVANCQSYRARCLLSSPLREDCLQTIAFGSFAWEHISNTDQAELNLYGMHNFIDLFHKTLSGPCAARHIALRVFDKLHPNIRYLAFKVNDIKRDNRRHALAHPVIPDEQVRELLREELHDGTPGLHPLEVAAFEHIKLTANTASNIRAANGGRRWSCWQHSRKQFLFQSFFS